MTDTTQAHRQSRRRAKLDAAARAAGWMSWSAYETAVVRGKAKAPRAVSDEWIAADIAAERADIDSAAQ